MSVQFYSIRVRRSDHMKALTELLSAISTKEARVREMDAAMNEMRENQAVLAQERDKLEEKVNSLQKQLDAANLGWA